MRSKAAGDAAPYNHLYRPEKDGLATTFAGFAAPALGVKDPYAATPDQVKQIARGHLLLAGANASAFGLPRAKALYGPLPEQLKDPSSFASRLKAMLAARKKYRVAEGEL